MAHEMAHIRRYDALIEDLASLVTVLHWFNPLVWMALSRLRIERERDCDNAVLRSGVKPSDYAMQLMEMAEDLTGDISLAWQPARISQDANLKDRLLHILNSNVSRETAGRAASFVPALLLALVILPLAVLGFWEGGGDVASIPKVQLPSKSEHYWTEVGNPQDSAAYYIECVLNAEGLAAAEHRFQSLMARPETERRYYFKEDEFNQLGYRYLTEDRVSEAITILKMNVFLFPQSWNVYDSLGEALYAGGFYDAAYDNFERSLKLGSKNVKGAQKFMQAIEGRRLAAADAKG
jgi:tetratricopeptide (TPR) repeat protein